MTSDVIERLAADLRPVRSNAVPLRIATGVAGGMLVSTAFMLAWLGLRPDWTQAVAAPSFWIKFAYTALLSAAGLWFVERTARPGVSAGGSIGLLGAVIAVIAGLALLQVTAASPDSYRRLLLGSSALTCPFTIVLLAAPVLAGVFWALKGLAPTRPAWAGLAAGLAAGAIGAWIYAFACDESAMPFVAIWYSAGIAAVGAIGSVLGRRFLRW